MVFTEQGNSESSSTTRGVVIIVSVFILIALMLTGMIYLEGQIYDGVRSYVRGEGLWAKAQKDAALYLERYSYEKSEQDYAAFEQAMQVSQGDRNARLALQQSPPDLKAARRGFLQGQNNELDIDSMIWFFQHFQNISYMRDAIAIWRKADDKLEKLATVGKDLRRIVSSENPDPRQLGILKARLKVLNTQLLELENQFSSVLSEGARWVKSTVWHLTLILLFVSIGAGIAISRRIVRATAKIERELRFSEARFNSLKDSNTIGIASWDVDGSMTDANETFLNMLGFSYIDLKEGRINWRGLTPVDLHQQDELAIQELARYGRCDPYEKSFFHKQGHRVPVYLGASTLDGDNTQGIAFIIDMSERKKAEEELQLAGMVFKSSSEGIMVTDEHNRIIATNPAFSEITGYSFDEVKGRNPKLLKSDRHEAKFYLNMWQSLDEKGTWQGEVHNRRKDGSFYVERLAINAIYNGDGSVHRWVAIFSDITEQKEAEEFIRRQANYDLLTGLPNRRMVHDRLEQQIKKSNREGLSLALLFVDLDLFKQVNDNLGHDAGDEVLREFARRMITCVRDSDTVGRLGGDEFTIILGGLHGIGNVERIVSDLLTKLSKPVALADQTVSVSASIGIAFYPQDAQDATTLLRNADQSMYAAKHNGRNTVHYYEHADSKASQDRVQ